MRLRIGHDWVARIIWGMGWDVIVSARTDWARPRNGL
jgi:hypothetical protein